ncbi:hypothetical protein D3C81_1515700 [compost metagenome]
MDVVVIQTGHVLTAADPRQPTQQRLHRRRADVRHATTQLHDILARHRTNQLQHLIPLRNLHRALRRTADGGQLRQFAADRHKVAGLGFRRGQAAVFEHAIGLLHRAQTDPVFDAQGAHRWQPVTWAIEAVFDARAEQFGEVYIKGHGAASVR